MTEFAYLSRRYEEPLSLKKYNLVPHGVPLKAGQKLPNGGIILTEVAVRVFEYRMDTIVLCVTNGFQPFVSWARMITTDSPLATGGYQIMDTCAHGHYHTYLDDAVAEFKKRVNEKREMFDMSGTLVKV